MASQGNDDTEQLTGSPPSVRDQTRSTYDTLIRQSQKLGQKATKAMSEARDMIGQQLVGTAQKDKEDIEELKRVISHSHEVIASAGTVLPFLFSDDITLDRTKITITKRNFILSAEVISIHIEDVLNVSAAVGPIFGSLRISSRVMNSVDHFDIGRFWRDDAIRIKKIIQGYLIARQNGVQTDHLSCEELAKTLFEIDPERYT